METTEVIKKHEKRFNRTRFMIKLLLVILAAFIIALQWSNINQLLNFFKTHIIQ